MAERPGYSVSCLQIQYTQLLTFPVSSISVPDTCRDKTHRSVKGWDCEAPGGHLLKVKLIQSDLALVMGAHFGQ